MPGLITHTYLALILNKIKPFAVNNKSMLIFFVIGNTLPDLFARVPYIAIQKYAVFFEHGHTLLGALVVAYFVSLFFISSIRKNVFCFLYGGAVFHQLTDLVQKNIHNTGYKLFFPLKHEVNIGFLWPEDSIYAIPFLSILLIILYRRQIVKIFKHNKNNSN